jgi:hypothetical protein
MPPFRSEKKYFGFRLINTAFLLLKKHDLSVEITSKYAKEVE